MINIQDFRCYTKQQIYRLIAIEQLLIILAFILGFVASSHLWFVYKDSSASLIFIACAYGAIVNISMMVVGLYKKYMNMCLVEQYLRLAVAMFLVLVVLNNTSYWLTDFDLGKHTWFSSILIAYALLICYRTIFSVMTKNHNLKSKTIIFGASNKALQLKNSIESLQEMQTEIIGYICKPGERDRMPRETILDISVNNNSGNELLDYCLENNINTIVVAVDDRRNNFPLSQLLECKQNGVNIIELMEFYEDELQRVELSILDPSWIIYSNKSATSKRYAINKRVMDVLLASLLILFITPVILLVGLLLKLSHGFSKSIFIKRSYLGQFNKPIINYEFNCYNKHNKLSLVGNIICKIKLQSILLIYNIIRGDLSFVGPQLIDQQTDQLLAKHYWFYKQRYSIKPGLISWGYVYQDYKSKKNDNEKINIAKNQLQYDLFYLSRSNLLLDIILLLYKPTYRGQIESQFNSKNATI